MKKQLIPMFVTLLTSAPAMAAVPLSFTFHGNLLEDGNPVNEQRSFTAAIVDNNNQVISSSTQMLQIENGQYLMTIDNIDVAKVQDADTLFLTVKVDGVALEPNLVINSVPYALSAVTANVADSVNCEGCITPENLSFVPNLEGFEIPACQTGELLRAVGNKWECTNTISIDNALAEATVTHITGNLGLNATQLYGHVGLSSYVVELQAEKEIADNLLKCPCDVNDQEADCDQEEGFSSTDFSAKKCYDQFEAAGTTLYNTFQISGAGTNAPVAKLLVVNNGKVGIGTGLPQAPLHIRAAQEETNGDIVIDDFNPEIKLSSLDQSRSYSIKLTDNGLEFINNTTGKKVVINDGYLTADRQVNEWEARRNNVKAQGSYSIKYTTTFSATSSGSGSAPIGTCTTTAKVTGVSGTNINTSNYVASNGTLTIYFTSPITNPASATGSVDKDKIQFTYTQTATVSGVYSTACSSGTKTTPTSFTVYGED